MERITLDGIINNYNKVSNKYKTLTGDLSSLRNVLLDIKNDIKYPTFADKLVQLLYSISFSEVFKEGGGLETALLTTSEFIAWNKKPSDNLIDYFNLMESINLEPTLDNYNYIKKELNKIFSTNRVTIYSKDISSSIELKEGDPIDFYAYLRSIGINSIKPEYDKHPALLKILRKARNPLDPMKAASEIFKQFGSKLYVDYNDLTYMQPSVSYYKEVKLNKDPLFCIQDIDTGEVILVDGYHRAYNDMRSGISNHEVLILSSDWDESQIKDKYFSTDSLLNKVIIEDPYHSIQKLIMSLRKWDSLSENEKTKEINFWESCLDKFIKGQKLS